MIGRALLVVSFSLAAAYPGYAQGWGSIKGKVEWTNPMIPEPRNLLMGVPPANIPACVKGNVLPSDELLIDKETKGVANVMVWLAALQDANSMDKKPAAIPIHPDLKAVPKENVVIDQPCCLFEPRVVIVREGQTLEVRNSAAFSHSFSFSGDPERNGGKNSTIPAGGKLTFDLKSQKRPLTFSCTLHTWMEGRIVVVNHPYFAISKKDGTFEIKNAPAGKFLLYISHEKGGWVQKGKASSGQEIQIKAGETLDLDKFAMP
jgi:plastocyanin